MRNWNRDLALSLVLILLSVCSFGAIAPALAAYKPPTKPSAPSRGTTITTGTRNSCFDELGVTPLAPQTHVGQTTASHPTFAWFVPPAAKSSPAIEFRLFTATGQRLYKASYPHQTGLMQATLPLAQPGLEIGQRYYWQVVVTCETATATVTTTEIERIALAPDLATALAAAQPPQQVQLYAVAGLWYDALAAAGPVTNSRPSASLLNLLDDLAQAEADSAPDWSKRLRDILVVAPPRSRQSR
jgi:Domain of Unknown Function (DUF928)